MSCPRYACNRCGEPIFFTRRIVNPRTKQVTRRPGNKPFVIHVNGRCGQRGFGF